MKLGKKLCLSTSCIALASGLSVSAQDATTNQSALAIEEVVVTGSRRPARTNADTPAPVDVIGQSEFANQGGGDMSNLLRTVVPSYNVKSEPINDASTFIRPANLRGLAPDQNLILTNGKRRHRAAVITFLGTGLADGAQGADVSVFPAIALKQVEVLRDGASAQYGSDAISGVINFVLRDDNEGGTFEAKWGQTYEGDGDQVQFSANKGLPLGDSGFLNLSAEWRESKATSRSVQRDDAQALIDGGNTAVANPAQVWGLPELKNDWKAFVNFGVEMGENAEFYGFGNYAQREVEGGFYYRNPDTRSGVNVAGNQRLIGDMTPGDGITCSGGINFNEGEATTGTVVNPHIVGAADDAARLAVIAADPNCFVFNEMFPGGFTPQFGGVLNDISGAMGIRGEFDNGLTYDVSAHGGRNEINFNIKNTVNPSLGSATPTEFDLGAYIQLEKNLNADFSYPVEVGFYSPLNVAFGAEWREEQWEATIGQIESWETGILAQPFSLRNDVGDIVSGNQGFGVAANGFAGFSPQVAGQHDRSNLAFYIDLETDVTENWILGFAARYEDFSDFGSTTNWKVSTLYRFSDAFRFRSTYSTGFRAPTIGQQQVVNISTVFETVDGRLQLAQRGTIPPTNPVAASFGGEQLGPEKSKSFSAGFSFDLGAASVTVDYFNIKLRDRITQSATINLSQQQRDDLVASGVTFAADLQAFRFFVNDFKTKTQGVDVVATIPLELTDSGSTNLTFSGNYTKTEVTDHNPGTLDQLRIDQIEKSLPTTRFNTTLTHNEETWRALARVNYASSIVEYHVGSGDLAIDVPGEFTVDVELGYTVTEGLEISVGAANLFNNYPILNPFGAAVAGAKYPVEAPLGFNGGSYYLRARYSF